MGWTETVNGYSGDVKSFLIGEMEGDTGINHFKVLGYRRVGNEVYIAMERISNETGEQIVFAIVCLIRFKDGNIAYKDMDETVEPSYYNCPESILKLLTEPINEHAETWRKKCRVGREKRKELNNDLKIGNRLLLETDIKFADGNQTGVLEVTSEKPLIFNGRYRVSKKYITDLGYEVEVKQNY